MNLTAFAIVIIAAVLNLNSICIAAFFHLFPGPLLHDAHEAGVLILPYHCRLDPSSSSVTLLGRLPFVDLYATSISTDMMKEPCTDDIVSSVVKNNTKKAKIKIERSVSTITDMTTDDLESDAPTEGSDRTALSALHKSTVAAAAAEIVSVKRVRSKKIT